MPIHHHPSPHPRPPARGGPTIRDADDGRGDGNGAYIVGPPLAGGLGGGLGRVVALGADGVALGDDGGIARQW
jgi:hypothetical protein